MPTIDVPIVTQKFMTRYPAIFSNPNNRSEIMKFITAGDEEKAKDYARQILDRNTNLKAHNKIAIDQRLQHREWLIYQVRVEKELKNLYDKLADKIVKVLMRSADDSGVIPFAKTKKILERIRDLVYEAYSEITVLLKGAVRKSIRDALIQTSDAAQTGVDFAQEEKDIRFSDLDVKFLYDLTEAPLKPSLLTTSGVFKRIFDRVKKMRLKKGLFPSKSGPRLIGAYSSGQSLSQYVWNIRQDHLTKMRSIVSSGIAAGRPATSIAKDIEKFTRASIASKAKTVVARRPGVYASAYKNALRVARTEMNAAYTAAQVEYIQRKEYKVQWHVTYGNVCPICAPRDGKVYDPNNVDIPAHVNCSCYISTFIPGLSEEL